MTTPREAGPPDPPDTHHPRPAEILTTTASVLDNAARIASALVALYALVGRHGACGCQGDKP